MTFDLLSHQGLDVVDRLVDEWACPIPPQTRRVHGNQQVGGAYERGVVGVCSYTDVACLHSHRHNEESQPSPVWHECVLRSSKHGAHVSGVLTRRVEVSIVT